jgi:hypothetical protein
MGEKIVHRGEVLEHVATAVDYVDTPSGMMETGLEGPKTYYSETRGCSVQIDKETGGIKPVGP